MHILESLYTFLTKIRVKVRTKELVFKTCPPGVVDSPESPVIHSNVVSFVSQLLLAVVILSWSYVIYASRIASHWLLEKRTTLLQQD